MKNALKIFLVGALVVPCAIAFSGCFSLFFLGIPGVYDQDGNHVPTMPSDSVFERAGIVGGFTPDVDGELHDTMFEDGAYNFECGGNFIVIRWENASAASFHNIVAWLQANEFTNTRITGGVGTDTAVVTGNISERFDYDSAKMVNEVPICAYVYWLPADGAHYSYIELLFYFEYMTDCTNPICHPEH
jgi:hypothetical protein